MPELTIETTVDLCDGNKMPLFGFGTFRLADGDEAENAVRCALESGYRHIDTAAVYGNEESVGRALADSGVPREEVFVTTKVWINAFGRDATRQACEDSLQRLGLDYVDLYLIHWPVDDTMMGAWEAMQKLRDQGKCRSIGVSNFSVRRLEEAFFPHTDEVPAVNQVEFHPFLFKKDLLEYCVTKGIRIESWGSLTRSEKFGNPTLAEIARETGKTPAQVLLRWHLQHGVIIIPKSAHAERICENADVFDVGLSSRQMSRLDALNDGFTLSAWLPCPSDEWY